MQVVIPMSGRGQRFLNAGYSEIKPLIKTDGLTLIEHIVKLFNPDDHFIFICRDEHLETTNLRNVLKKASPHAVIVPIEGHKKGPVYAVKQAFDHIDDQQQVIVNYCDFSKAWDYKTFLNQVNEIDIAGAITAYRGFHPHMLGHTQYAFIRETQGFLDEIREKKPFTENRMQEFASDGSYYFQNGAVMKKYFDLSLKRNLPLNGEYYVSEVYNLMVEDGLKVWIHEIEHMLQWGEPADFEEYQQWSHYFRSKNEFDKREKKIWHDINLIPMAGKGQRFVDEGYEVPKPLIPAGQRSMISEVCQSLPKAQVWRLVCRDYVLEESKFDLSAALPDAEFHSLNHTTSGQATTVKEGLAGLSAQASLFVASCDHGVIWNAEKYKRLIEDFSIDAIVWTCRKHPPALRHPEMYGWVHTCPDGLVENVAVKQPASSNIQDDAVMIGAFYFRQLDVFEKAYQMLFDQDERVNNEFYVDSCIKLLNEDGRRIATFDVEHYISFGTPNELKTYNYWFDFFSKCEWHPFEVHEPRPVS